VFLDGEVPEFYVASRGHHADIGGITPGSMPPDSTHVDEEGVLLDNVQLVARGRFLESETRAILASGRYPARNVEQNLADLRAQVAACAKGAEELPTDGRAFLAAGRARVHDARAGQRRGVGAPRARRAEGRELRRTRWTTARSSASRSASTARRREATVDFTGTSRSEPTNFNAPSAVCKAAVLYVFRTLVDDEIPMNAGASSRSRS
jgi:5-oxoprolinase (ATP-hydrolysing)